MDEVRNGGYVRQGWVLNIHKVATVSGRMREREIGVCAEICVCFRACYFATRVATETCWSSAQRRRRRRRRRNLPRNPKSFCALRKIEEGPKSRS